jgi:transcription initiation factor IIE alpha subunit
VPKNLEVCPTCGINPVSLLIDYISETHGEWASGEETSIKTLEEKIVELTTEVLERETKFKEDDMDSYVTYLKSKIVEYQKYLEDEDNIYYSLYADNNDSVLDYLLEKLNKSIKVINEYED